MAKIFGSNIVKQTVTVYPGGTAFVSELLDGTGEAQTVGHGLPFVPTKVLVLPSNLPAGSAWGYDLGTVNDILITVTATAGVQYRVFAWTGVASTGPVRLTAPNNSVWEVRTNELGVLLTSPAVGMTGIGSVVIEGQDGSRWFLTVDNEGVLNTDRATDGYDGPISGSEVTILSVQGNIYLKPFLIGGGARFDVTTPGPVRFYARGGTNQYHCAVELPLISNDTGEVTTGIAVYQQLDDTDCANLKLFGHGARNDFHRVNGSRFEVYATGRRGSINLNTYKDPDDAGMTNAFEGLVGEINFEPGSNDMSDPPRIRVGSDAPAAWDFELPVNFKDDTNVPGRGAVIFDVPVTFNGDVNGSPYGTGGTQPYDIPMSVEGQALGDEAILRLVFTRNVSLAADFAGAYGAAGTPGGTDTILSVKKNGVEIGTITFAGASAVATFTTVGGVGQAFAPGDVMTVVAPTVMTTLANFAITLAGTR